MPLVIITTRDTVLTAILSGFLEEGKHELTRNYFLEHILALTPCRFVTVPSMVVFRRKVTAAPCWSAVGLPFRHFVQEVNLDAVLNCRFKVRAQRDTLISGRILSVQISSSQIFSYDCRVYKSRRHP